MVFQNTNDEKHFHGDLKIEKIKEINQINSLCKHVGFERGNCSQACSQAICYTKHSTYLDF